MNQEIYKHAFESAMEIGQKISYAMGHYGMDFVPAGLAIEQIHLTILKGMLEAIGEGDRFMEDLPKDLEDIEDERDAMLEEAGHAAYKQGVQDRKSGREAKYDASEILALAHDLNEQEREMLDRILSDERQELLDLFFDGDVEAYEKVRNEADSAYREWKKAGKPDPDDDEIQAEMAGLSPVEQIDSIIASIRRWAAMGIQGYVESGLHPKDIEGVDIEGVHAAYLHALAAKKLLEEEDS